MRMMHHFASASVCNQPAGAAIYLHHFIVANWRACIFHIYTCVTSFPGHSYFNMCRIEADSTILQDGKWQLCSLISTLLCAHFGHLESLRGILGIIDVDCLVFVWATHWGHVLLPRSLPTAATISSAQIAASNCSLHSRRRTHSHPETYLPTKTHTSEVRLDSQIFWPNFFSLLDPHSFLIHEHLLTLLLCSVQCEHCVQCAVWAVCAVSSVQCVVCSVQFCSKRNNDGHHVVTPSVANLQNIFTMQWCFDCSFTLSLPEILIAKQIWHYCSRLSTIHPFQ